MFRRPLFIAILFHVIAFPTIAFPKVPVSDTSVQEVVDNALATFNYDIFIEDEDVGDMQIEMIDQRQGRYQILESTSIKVNSSWDEIKLSSTANQLYSSEHELISADKKVYEQTKPYWSKIDSFGDNFWMSVSEIENQDQKEEQELVGFSLAVLNNIIPQAGQILGFSQLLFSDEKVEPKSIQVPKNSHHTTLTHLPSYWLSQQQKLPAKINLLDIETISITEMDVQQQGSKIKTLNGTKVLTHHYTLSSQERPPVNIWLSINDNNIAYFFELKLESDNGVFTMRLKP